MSDASRTLLAATLSLPPGPQGPARELLDGDAGANQYVRASAPPPYMEPTRPSMRSDLSDRRDRRRPEKFEPLY